MNRRDLKKLVLRRDKGVCASCGLDTLRLRKALEKLQRQCERRLFGKESQECFEKRIIRRTSLRARVVALERAGFRGCFKESGYGFPKVSQALWEADHKVPLAIGGADDLENLQTLCRACHKQVTKRLARYRAHRRRKRLDLYAPETWT